MLSLEIPREPRKQLVAIVARDAYEESLGFGLELREVIVVPLHEVRHLLRREPHPIDDADVLLIDEPLAERVERLARPGVRAMEPEHGARDFGIRVDEA